MRSPSEKSRSEDSDTSPQEFLSLVGGDEDGVSGEGEVFKLEIAVSDGSQKEDEVCVCVPPSH